VIAARDAAIERIRVAAAGGEALQGWQVDRAARPTVVERRIRGITSPTGPGTRSAAAPRSGRQPRAITRPTTRARLIEGVA